MNRTISAAFAVLVLAAGPSSAVLYGGTDQNAIAAGGSFFFDTGTSAGSAGALEIHGGCYLFDSFLCGGQFAGRDDDAARTYELAALCQYHWLRLFDPSNDRPWGISPYAGLRLGAAHGKNPADSNTGAIAGLRIGLDLFFTDNVVLDLAFDWTACTAKVYPDDARLEKTDCVFRLGLDFHF